MIVGTHHTSISVTDLDTSIKFYRDILGLKVVHEIPKVSGPCFEAIDDLPPGSSCRTVFVTAGEGSYIQLSQYSPKGKGPRPDSTQCDIGLIHIGFRVTEAEKLFEAIREKGVKLNQSSVQIESDGSLKGFSLDDPDGVRIEFLQFIKEWDKHD